VLPSGTRDAPVREKIVTAENAPEAVSAAKRTPIDMVGPGTNAIYLTVAKGHGIGGHGIWSRAEATSSRSHLLTSTARPRCSETQPDPDGNDDAGQVV
jgi:hypothetical protein